MSPRLRLLWHAWVQTALWLLLFFGAAHLSGAMFARWDLTRDQRHSVSDLGRRTVSGLERPLHARVYFSEGLQPPYHDHRRALLDLLDELRSWSGGRLTITVVDPASDPELAAEATRSGVQPVPYVVQEHDRREARTVYMGVAFEYGERQASARALPSIPRMEQEVVQALRQVVVAPDDRLSLGWVVGHGEPDPAELPANSPLVGVRDELGTRYALSRVDLSRPLPPDLDALLLIAPRESITPVEQLRLDQHVMDGGGLVAFLSGVQPDFQRFRVVPVDHGLHAQLGRWGVAVGREVLVDRAANDRLALPVQGRWVEVDHPLAPVTSRLDRTHPAVRDLGRLVLPFVTPLQPVEPAPAEVHVEVWAESGPGSAALSSLPSLLPEVPADPDERAGPLPVVVGISGRLPSAWVGQPLPAGADRQADELVPRSRPTRVLVVGSGDASANSTDLVLNGVDWVLQDSDLLTIEARSGSRSALQAPSERVVWQLRLLMVGGPLGVLALLTWVVRRWGVA